MLQIKNLTVFHKKDLRTILEDFNFVLNDGDKTVIIGEEGNGKSTLLKLIYDSTLVEDYVEYSGEILTGRQKLGYIAQELPKEHWDKTVYEYFCEAPLFFDLTPAELNAIVGQIGMPLDMVYSDQTIATLSGGEKVKLQFARMLMEQPDVYLLDEPSNDIDIATLEWLERFIQKCDRPVLFVSHDETLIERTANSIVHIELVRKKTLPRYTVAHVPYREYIDRRGQALDRQTQQANKEAEEFDKKMDRYRKIRDRVEHQQNSISRQDPHGGRLLKKKMHAVLSMGRRFEKEQESMTQLPDVEDAIFMDFPEEIRMPNGKAVLEFRLDELTAQERVLSRNIELRVHGPQKVCIVGKNGAGKTTLIRRIAENLLSRKDIRAAYMSQNYEERLDMSATPVDFLNRSGSKEEMTRIRNYLGSVRYTPDEMSHAIGELSGGQKAKLLFIKMVLEGNDVLILDEPTRNFSPMSNPVIREILKNYGGAVISVSHDRKYIAEVCDVVYELTENGLIRQ